MFKLEHESREKEYIYIGQIKNKLELKLRLLHTYLKRKITDNIE
jgi:hypothetical protein